ncbi:putative ring finger membrane protein [Phaeoacremonium minimum UCRPA7]|uniref:RING-type E3 ubiquitin transferase n=1 Tax=Phaeoacremonium minimum (strain UCR-PA7) TaxID=1286976 RepID=R8BK82_PHAM7|nr:putative ring finger membrane protein [Phaeoacremonium minimum UCRPA7]EON99694.1 putative ring finger membrane protein [Phaeoacremonium minimum UCRPA7]
MEDAAADAGFAPQSGPSAHLRRRISSTEHTQIPPSSRPAAAAVNDPSASSEPDTCRICRGEATPSEPLFYPCKCSGSIKYVHQDCLMEWLSHSQKKHCELCKTPFRFTKLYSPDMPKSLPFIVFVSHIAKYIFRNFLVWARALLVVFVWLCWLPYLMRSVWSFLFWISDEGLGGGQSIFASQDASWDRLTGTSLSVSTFGTSVCPSSPLFAATTTAAVLGGAGSPLQTASDVVPHIVKSLYNINLTYIDPLPSTLLRFLFGAVGLSDTSSPFNASNNAEGAASSTAYTTPPTLLSDVSFLHMTKSRMFNLTLIAVLEGQIITVLSDNRTRVPAAEGSTVHEYLRIYREAGGDPEKILQIAKNEQLEDKLAYWIRLTQSMVERSRPSDGEAIGEASTSARSQKLGSGYAPSSSGAPEISRSGTSRNSDRSSEWEWPDDLQSSDSGSAEKGKGKAEWENLPDFNELEAVRRPTLEGALPPHQPGGLARLLADFMWQDVDAIDPGELPPLPDDGNDFADHDDPFAPLGEDPVPQDIERDREVVEAAAAAGLDAEAIEDAEDLEGIMELIEAILTINSELAYWSAMDRTWAILGGYLTVFFVAGLYLRRGSPFSRGQAGQEWEASVIDGLNQASGVMKVILIIGIEMLIFPLYCGLLLDIALLPLFENTSIISRILFTVNYPLTSIFVHWFVGTGYMFHFALFVSMCRKIMRKGVLYFIRDPDDPEFHPVRDVLERNVTTQLRKILFSAFVYGALVIICLGGVVWGLAYSIPNVLPIHYSSNEPVLEFPIDLLFYNFLMPLAVKFFKPSDGLHAMYTWWFRKCARALRISWFLFGERRIDEEGTLVLAPGSPHRSLAWWKRQLLELTEDNNVIPKTWRDTFEGGKAKPTSTIPSDDMIHLNVKKVHLVQSQQLIPDGRFVRSPASDQVKIPKGKQVFLDVSENNLRLDGKADLVETDLYSTNQYQFVYIPPNFRLRVFLFIMFIWIFAAVTGVGFTIIPLAFGRQMFHLLIPSHIRTNDIYAFSIGIYLLGSLAYSIVHIHSLIKNARNWTRDTLSTMLQRDAVRRVARVVRHGAKLVYAYLFLLIIFPLMVSSLMELYFLIPLDTYMYSAILSTTVTRETAALGIHGPKHTIRVIQSWTIGVLYLKLGARIVASWYRDTRMTAAIRAVLRRGWLEPDVSILTRAFVVPGVLLWVLAVAGPLISARIFVQYGALGPVPDDAALTLIYRLSFPIAAMGAVGAYILWSLIDVFRSWRVRIRDEAYLIGERLHNFGVGTHV